MVNKRKNDSRKMRIGKGIHKKQSRPRKINASTQYGTCSEQISPFGGLLALIKFIDLIGFKEIFDSTYKKPVRKPRLGHYSMVVGILMLLFIGFGAVTGGKGFRIYSIITILTIVIFGALAAIPGSQIATGLPTPWLGVIERVSYYSPFVWVLVFAVCLLRAPGYPAPPK